MTTNMELIFDQQLSTGECSHALHLGCKECETCKVLEYEKELRQAEKQDEEDLNKMLNDEYAWFEQELLKEEQENKEIYYDDQAYDGIPLNRWNCHILNCMVDFIKESRPKGTKIVTIHYFDEPYFTHAVWIVYKNKGHYCLEDVFF